MSQALSIFDMFTIGIGSSSSHTVGPMRAALRFRQALLLSPELPHIAGIRAQCYGSLAATGHGHGTDTAIMLGLLGEAPETVNTRKIPAYIAELEQSQTLRLTDDCSLSFIPARDVDLSNHIPLKLHPNGMHFSAVDANNEILYEEVFYSTGGGFIATQDELIHPERYTADIDVPFPYTSAAELLEICRREQLSISDVVFCNELAWHNEQEVRERLAAIWTAMRQSIASGIQNSGTLPGPLRIERRAKIMRRRLLMNGESLLRDPLSILDWVNLYAMAVSEENAAGGRIVTAPTNGAAGILPAVLNYAVKFCTSPYSDATDKFLLTAGGIGVLYKLNASISGADVGCQGEVGVACSMAAAALTELLGGTPAQAACAAEIAMEHNLGLTCDPVCGLVQIPCIERNAVAAVKALNASRLALCGNGKSFVTLDQVMKTMLATGRDMQSKYKETAQGGLAVNVVNC
ncbi:L-serine ammonia-lyase [Akkermansia glycaniphila]|uniref:L-serine dehydratase n=1 Tax=Akkermansia glycaniphila TaxID=1679444 RepID=A0A1C7P986_9BACT|nr:L-serine ammonia-lyase [Akkermansia glycaniphila]OCA02048.1 serine dehydratase [Akkermansia glycaniphila]SEH93645.1 sda mono: l-serine ammonia-lyase [Akkermansia glycaniphila]